jgi:4-diphosphocytidyl-2-C-methyl-D-erythritol kinase
MIAFPNAKINLGLKVLHKRSDGFHNIETIFYPVGLSDVLEIIPAKDGVLSFTATGLRIPGDPKENLCLKAFHLLSSIFHLPPVKIHLHKVIPIGAGLGGGSSDGAFTIKLLNDLFLLELSDDQTMDHARTLGSDCAFFIVNKPAFAFDKGDQFEFLDMDLSEYRIEIETPEIHINTGEAYALIKLISEPSDSFTPLKEIISQPIEVWKNLLVNDFEQPVFKKYPELEKIKQDFFERGALYTSMSGSGSSIYGIFPSFPTLATLLPVSML